MRGLAVHPTLPFVLTCSDDMSIKLWDWDKDWSLVRLYEGHTHYVMGVQFNPKACFSLLPVLLLIFVTMRNPP